MLGTTALRRAGLLGQGLALNGKFGAVVIRHPGWMLGILPLNGGKNTPELPVPLATVKDGNAAYIVTVRA